MNHYSHLFFVASVSLFFLSCSHAANKKVLVQDNPVLAPDVAVPPVIDGRGDDPCWQYVKWQSIDQVWIPYGGQVAAGDYSGRYKIVWSSSTNLLYFLVEVTDDVFVDGYVPGQTADIYNFDISEIFIDEDTSGGEHRYDGSGTNAENAFAYHMYADFPIEGQVTTVCQVDDMAGTQSSSRRANYTSHFPEFALRTTGTTAIREFSLIVYNDSYEDTMANKDAARARLAVGKVMGLSVAYCDNDDPKENPKVRDNMFGSVWEPSPGNLHWMNADYFGRVKLVSDLPSSVASEHVVQANTLMLFPNPASSSSQLQVDNIYRGMVSIQLFNLLGQEIFRTAADKTDGLFTRTLVLNHLPSGLYLIRTQMGSSAFCEKLIITPKK